MFNLFVGFDWIPALGDRPANDNCVAAELSGLARGNHPLLVTLSRILRTNTGSDTEEVRPRHLSDSLDFPGGANYPVRTGTLRQPGVILHGFNE